MNLGLCFQMCNKFYLITKIQSTLKQTSIIALFVQWHNHSSSFRNFHISKKDKDFIKSHWTLSSNFQSRTWHTLGILLHSLLAFYWESWTRYRGKVYLWEKDPIHGGMGFICHTPILCEKCCNECSLVLKKFLLLLIRLRNDN